MKTAEQKRTIRKFKTEIKKFINKGISSGEICLKFEEKNINRALKDFFQKIILENPKNPLSFIEKYSLYVKSGDTFIDLLDMFHVSKELKKQINLKYCEEMKYREKIIDNVQFRLFKIYDKFHKYGKIIYENANEIFGENEQIKNTDTNLEEFLTNILNEIINKHINDLNFEIIIKHLKIEILPYELYETETIEILKRFYSDLSKEVKNIIQAEKAKTLESAIFVALYLKSLKIIDKYRETIKGIIEAKQKEEKKWLNS